MVARSTPGPLLGIFVIAGTVAAALAIRPSAGRTILPVPALAYLVAALISGVVFDHEAASSNAALAIGAAQWVADGFFAMVLATVLAVVITLARWYLWRRRRPAARDRDWAVPAATPARSGPGPVDPGSPGRRGGGRGPGGRDEPRGRGTGGGTGHIAAASAAGAPRDTDAAGPAREWRPRADQRAPAGRYSPAGAVRPDRRARPGGPDRRRGRRRTRTRRRTRARRCARTGRSAGTKRNAAGTGRCPGRAERRDQAPGPGRARAGAVWPDRAAPPGAAVPRAPGGASGGGRAAGGRGAAGGPDRTGRDRGHGELGRYGPARRAARQAAVRVPGSDPYRSDPYNFSSGA